jgi:hypothetical protein
MGSWRQGFVYPSIQVLTISVWLLRRLLKPWIQNKVDEAKIIFIDIIMSFRED